MRAYACFTAPEPLSQSIAVVSGAARASAGYGHRHRRTLKRISAKADRDFSVALGASVRINSPKVYKWHGRAV